MYCMERNYADGRFLLDGESTYVVEMAIRIHHKLLLLETKM